MLPAIWPRMLPRYALHWAKNPAIREGRIGNSNHLFRPNRVRVTGLTVSASLPSTGLARQTRPPTSPAGRRCPGAHPDSARPRR
jgi:hypothetical protein